MTPKWAPNDSHVHQNSDLISTSLSGSILSFVWVLRTSKSMVLLKEFNGFWEVTHSHSDQFWAQKLPHLGAKIDLKISKKRPRKLIQKQKAFLAPKWAQNDSKMTPKWAPNDAKIGKKSDLISTSLSGSIFSCFWLLRTWKSMVLLKEFNGFWKVARSLSYQFWPQKWPHFGPQMDLRIIKKRLRKLTQKKYAF